MSKTVAIGMALAVIALTAPTMALDRDHEDRGTRLQDNRGTRTVYLSRGGWDGNGPDMFGTVEEDRGTRMMYRSGRGGWDANGPGLSGQSAAIDLGSVVIEAIELPGGERLSVTQD